MASVPNLVVAGDPGVAQKLRETGRFPAVFEAASARHLRDLSKKGQVTPPAAFMFGPAFVEDVPGAEVLSLGKSLEIVKDLGNAETVARQYRLGEFRGTHAIGHVRMATESDVDIAGAHPYWAYPFSDVAVVHNGQLTNYHQWRRRLERLGHRFQSE